MANDVAAARPPEVPSLDEMQELGGIYHHVLDRGPSFTREQRAEWAAKMDRASGRAAALHARIVACLVPATERDVAGFLAGLKLAFPQGLSKTEADGLAKMMFGDVMDEKPMIGELMVAAKALRRRCKFMPSIAEVLAELEAARVSLRWRSTQMEDFERMRASLSA